MSAAILNSAFAVFLGVFCIQEKKAFAIMLSLFLYVSFHYSYAALPIFSPSFSYSEYNELHRHTESGVKLVGCGFLLFIAGLLSVRHRGRVACWTRCKVSKRVGAALLLWAVVVVIRLLINVTKGAELSVMTLQNLFSALLMVILAWAFGLVLQDETDLSAKDHGKIGWILFVVILLMILVGSWEILSFRAWSSFALESRHVVWRASSLLFNPNVLGFWCAFVAIFTAYSFHLKMTSGKLSALLLTLAGFGMLLSGSRTGLIFCLFTLGLASLLLFWLRKSVRARIAIMPLFIFASSFATISLLVKSLSKLTGHLHEGLFALALLVDRFANTPRDVTIHAFSKLSSSGWLTWTERTALTKSLTKSLSKYLSKPVSKSTAMSIDGRFGGRGVDNGYLVMLQDAGWLSLAAWIALLLVLAWIGGQTLRRAPEVKSAYSFSLVLGCALTGVFMRAFQVFPFWVIISLALGTCLAWFGCVFQRQ